MTKDSSQGCGRLRFWGVSRLLYPTPLYVRMCVESSFQDCGCVNELLARAYVQGSSILSVLPPPSSSSVWDEEKTDEHAYDVSSSSSSSCYSFLAWQKTARRKDTQTQGGEANRGLWESGEATKKERYSERERETDSSRWSIDRLINRER